MSPQNHVRETRDRILDAAEKLFAEHGLEVTTLRMITHAAKANLAAVNYHFGGKDALIHEVFKRRLAWLNEQRLRNLDLLEAEARGSPLRPNQIIQAFFGPPLSMADDNSRGGRRFMRLLARTYTEPSEFVRNFMAQNDAAVLERFRTALFRALPHVAPDEIAWRLHFMLGALAFALSGVDTLRLVTGFENIQDSPEALEPRLMSFLLGGLRAPLPDLELGPSPPVAFSGIRLPALESLNE